LILPAAKQAGACLHLTSLPGKYGCGEIGAQARNFVDALVSMNLRVWQFLPAGPTGYGNSPYQSLSTFAGNELLIDSENLVELGLVRSDELRPLMNLPQDRIDFASLIPLKNALLAHAADAFPRRANAQLRQELDAFNEANDRFWLRDYALYRVLKGLHGEQSWIDWGSEFRLKSPRALSQAASDHGALLDRTRILQFLFARQWAELRRYADSRGVQLFGDLPIYIAMDSADSWAHPELLLTGQDGRPAFVAGVPPDYFSADGQLWGNPLYDWPYHAANDYAWWVERLRHASAMADMVRIDHFRGFESYWAVPAAAANARTGRWEQGPADRIFDAIRAALGDLPVIAEDLGIITPAVEQLRERQGIPGMRVLQFDVAGEYFDIDKITENSVCYTGTHDNDTTLGWFNNLAREAQPDQDIADIRTQVLARTGGTAATIHQDLIRLAFSSAARLAMVPMQDYLGLDSVARMNIPGTVADNWRWRLLQAQLTPQLAESVCRMTALAGRDTAMG